MERKVIDKERQHLSNVISKVDNAKKQLIKVMDSVGAANLDRLKELRENPETGMDFQLFLEQLHESNLAFNFKDKYQRLDEYDYLLKEPYFARIDLKDKGSGLQKSYYIGKFGYTEKTPVVTDWRTKVASIYYRYRYPQKDVKYESPEGEVKQDLTLKRTFEIDNGELVKYFNNDIQLDESEIIIDKIEQRTGGVLEDIVETIQESQLDIIESDPRQICIVQGCVGSGKSTVAIHKLSHVFFNYPNYIRPERSILIAKNQILVSYLSTLFPKLGIFDINYKTLRDLMVNMIFREELGLKYDMDKEQDTSSIDLKYIKRIEKRISEIFQEVEEKTQELLNDDEFISFGGFKFTKKLTSYENLAELISDLEEELSMQKEKLKNDPNSVKAWIFKDNIKTLRKLIRKIYKIRSDLKDSQLKKVLKSFNIDKKVELTYTDALIYLKVYASLIGLKKIQKYEYCVIDEGQDFSVLEYSVLALFVLRGRFAIFGDLNQSIEGDGVGNWENIQEVIKEAKQASTFKLETNYRSTKPIIDYANRVLSPYTKKYLPNSINRTGIDPVIRTFDSKGELINNTIDEIDRELHDLNKSIGIITHDDIIFEKISEYMKDKKRNDMIILDKDKSINYIPKGVYLINNDYCKGLEFSKVYVLGLPMDRIDNFMEAKQAFVTITRAMNELHVYWSD